MTTPLQKAAQAVIDRWDAPACEKQPQTAEYIYEQLRKALDAEIAQAVEPVAVFNGLVDSGEHGAFNLDMLKMIPRGAHLYLHPPQPNYGWLDAVDKEMVCAHLGVANVTDTFDEANAKLLALINWHVAVATDPVVNGGLSLQPQATTVVPEGYVLVPIEPTGEELTKGVHAMRLFVTKNSLIDFSLGYKAMLAAAQGEKP